MKKIAWLAFALVLISCSSVSAQQAPPYDYPNHLNDPNPGDPCQDYNLDIVRLTDNNHQIYWKQFDCILVHTRNNPFIFKYDLAFDEKLIPEDDPLAAFAGKFGLNVGSSASPAPTTTPAAKSPATQTAEVSAQALSKFSQVEAVARQQDSSLYTFQVHGKLASKASVDPSQVIDQSKQDFQKGDFASARKKLEDTQDKLRALRNSQTDEQKRSDLDNVNKKLTELIASINRTEQLTKAEGTPKDTNDTTIAGLRESAAMIHSALAEKQKAYVMYSTKTPSDLLELVDPSHKLDRIRQTAISIRDTATSQLNQLTDHNPAPGEFGSQQDEARFLEFAAAAAQLHKTSLTTEQADQLEQIGRRVVYDACAYKAFIDGDVSSIKTGILDPINAVLNDPLAFGYVIPARKREGPWANPESVTLTVTRTSQSVFAAVSADGKTPQNTTSKFECSSDTTDLFEFGSTYTSFQDFFSDKPVTAQNLTKDTDTSAQVKQLPNLYLKNPNSPKAIPAPQKQTGTTGSQAPTGTAQNAPAPAAKTDNTVLVQPWLFGKARLVLTGGLTEGILRKQEFQRSSSINGTTSPTLIGLKTNTVFRNSPMLYGHVLLYSRRHDPDAWYGTFGVTSNSDTKGTDPEFLLGLSRSFAQQRFFLTAGAYIGERQKLDAGLQVGQTIPSTLTGDLPVTKSYHVGYGVGISFRLASTKNPQDTTTTKPATKNTKNQGGS